MNKDDYKWYRSLPQWINKAKEIKKRDKVCQMCGANKMLNAHHIRYINGKLPWQYTDEYLITLCRDCHKYEHDKQKELSQMLSEMKMVPIWADELIERLKGIPD